MYYTVRKSNKIDLIRQLHAKCFPGEEFYEHKKNSYWVVMDRNGNSMGFGICTDYGNGVLFLSRAGVINKYRGNGIHKRIIEMRIRFGRRMGFKSIITYTARGNHASVNNLIAKGFKSYTPAKQYVGPNFDYWILEL